MFCLGLGLVLFFFPGMRQRNIYVDLLLLLLAAMLLHVKGKLERHHQPSLEFNVPDIKTCLANVFPSARLCICSFMHQSKSTTSKHRNFQRIRGFLISSWHFCFYQPCSCRHGIIMVCVGSLQADSNDLWVYTSGLAAALSAVQLFHEHLESIYLISC